MQGEILLKNVNFSYYPGKQILQDINLTIKKNEFLGVTGLNGSGKTTLILLLNGLIPHQISGNLTGDILVNGRSTRSQKVSELSGQVGIVFQSADFMIFNNSVEEEILFGVNNFHLKDPRTRVADALNAVGLTGYEKRDPHTLSMGEKQRLAIACIFALDTSCIVLDEPCSMLDYQQAIKLYNTLQKLNKIHNKTIVVIEHDTDFLLKYSSSCAIIDKGRIISCGRTEKILSNKMVLKNIGIKIPTSVSLNKYE